MSRLKGSKNTGRKLEGKVLSIKAAKPDWSANQVRQYLKRTSNGNSFIPKLRTIQNILADGKPKLDAVAQSGQDKPWHLGTLRDYPLSAEAIHHILKVQKWMAKKGERSQVTLRLAKWISRFSKVISKDTAWLWKVSFAYTLFEIRCEISDTDFDTSHLDAALMAGGNQFDKIATDLVMLGDIHGAAMYQHEGLGNGKTYKKWADSEYNQSEVKNERTHNATK